MKKINYIGGLWIACLMLGCQENEQMVWSSMPGIYFTEYSNEADSVYHSFTTSTGDLDTVKLEVKLAGIPLEEAKQFQL